MRRRLALRLTAGLTIAAVLVLVVVLATTASSGDLGDPPSGPAVTVTVASGPGGPPIRAGYLGLSLEFQAVRAYTGTDARQINPVLVQLIRNLTPGQPPVLRIGGDSTDLSYVPAPGIAPSPFAAYALTPSWMATTGALARQLGARLIMGLNLAADRPRLAAAEVEAYARAFGPRSVAALEIGNEPNVYGKIRLFHTKTGRSLRARPKDYGFREFRRQFRAIAAVAPGTLAGPALALGPTAGAGSWVQQMSSLLGGEPRMRIMTVHRYPLRNCYVPPSSPQYPTIDHLLSSYATVGLAESLHRWVMFAHRERRRLRVDELNSVACRGKRGVSDAFASSLWAVDALFELARLGVDGVNLHTLPNSAYQLFEFSRADGRWRAHVKPVYYGLQLFAQAAPPGSRLLSVSEPSSAAGLSVWATRARDGRVRVVLINKSQLTRAITLRIPRGTETGATVSRLTAPSAGAQGAVTLGGRTYGAETYTGALKAPMLAPLREHNGSFTVTVPRASAALLTFGG